MDRAIEAEQKKNIYIYIFYFKKYLQVDEIIITCQEQLRSLIMKKKRY